MSNLYTTRSLLGDLNATYLLLNWGADPDYLSSYSESLSQSSGSTPLLYLVKNDGAQTKEETNVVDLASLLLRYGASDATDPEDILV